MQKLRHQASLLVSIIGAYKVLIEFIYETIEKDAGVASGMVKLAEEAQQHQSRCFCPQPHPRLSADKLFGGDWTSAIPRGNLSLSA